MAVALSTLIFSPLSASPESDATDTQPPGRVTAKVAPETAAVSPREEPRSSTRVVEEVNPKWGHAPPAARRVAPAATISGLERAEIQKATTHATSTSRAETCRSARIAAVYFRFRTWTHQELRDGRLASKSPIVAGKSCHWAKFAAREWQARARSARRSFYRWLNDRTLRDFGVHDGNHAWFKAIEQTQRAYPGTDWWLKACSADEGGWGRWVPNSDGASPGGWMQMVHSTFQSMMHGYYLPSTGRWYVGAWKDLRSRGFIVPRSALSWYSPLGQALSSAYGMRNGRHGEWAGAGCR